MSLDETSCSQLVAEAVVSAILHVDKESMIEKEVNNEPISCELAKIITLLVCLNLQSKHALSAFIVACCSPVTSLHLHETYAEQLAGIVYINERHMAKQLRSIDY